MESNEFRINNLEFQQYSTNYGFSSQYANQMERYVNYDKHNNVWKVKVPRHGNAKAKVHKNFSVKKYGNEKSYEMAVKYRDEVLISQRNSSDFSSHLGFEDEAISSLHTSQIESNHASQLSKENYFNNHKDQQFYIQSNYSTYDGSTSVSFHHSNLSYNSNQLLQINSYETSQLNPTNYQNPNLQFSPTEPFKRKRGRPKKDTGCENYFVSSLFNGLNSQAVSNSFQNLRDYSNHIKTSSIISSNNSFEDTSDTYNATPQHNKSSSIVHSPISTKTRFNGIYMPSQFSDLAETPQYWDSSSIKNEPLCHLASERQLSSEPKRKSLANFPSEKKLPQTQEQNSSQKQLRRSDRKKNDLAHTSPNQDIFLDPLSRSMNGQGNVPKVTIGDQTSLLVEEQNSLPSSILSADFKAPAANSDEALLIEAFFFIFSDLLSCISQLDSSDRTKKIYFNQVKLILQKLLDIIPQINSSSSPSFLHTCEWIDKISYYISELIMPSQTLPLTQTETLNSLQSFNLSLNL